MQHTPITIAHMLTNPRFVSPLHFASRERTVSCVERRGSESSIGPHVLTSERWLHCALIVLVLFLGSIPRAAAESASAVEVREVKLAAPSETTARISVATSAEPRFVARAVDGGKRLVIDISGADVKGTQGITRGNAIVARVSSQSVVQDNAKIARFSVELARAAEYRISTSPTGLVIDLAAADTTAPMRDLTAASEAAPTARPAGQTIAAAVTNVRFDHQPSKDRVIVELDAEAKFTHATMPNGRTVIEFQGVRLPDALERTLDVSAFGGVVTAVSTYRRRSDASRVVVEIEPKGQSAATISREGQAE